MAACALAIDAIPIAVLINIFLVEPIFSPLIDKKPYFLYSDAMKKAIQQAVRQAGSQHKLAAICHTSQQSITYWLRKGYVPTYRAAALISEQFDIPLNQLCEPDSTENFVQVK